MRLLFVKWWENLSWYILSVVIFSLFFDMKFVF